MQEKLDFTLLTEEQIFGYSQIDILEKYGTRCPITDFAILLGGTVSISHYTSEGNLRKDRTGCWWTKSYDGNHDAHVVYLNGCRTWNPINERNGGVRPALVYSTIALNDLNKVIEKNGITEVEYGEYPQTVVSANFSKIFLITITP